MVTEEGEEIPNHMSNVDFGRWRLLPEKNLESCPLAFSFFSTKNYCSSLEGYLTEGPGPSDYIQVLLLIEIYVNDKTVVLPPLLS